MSLTASMVTVLALATAGLGQGFVVNGKGTVPVKADRLEVRATLKVEAELAKDAQVKLSQSRGRINRAFAELEIEGLTMKGLGVRTILGLDGGAMAELIMMGEEETPDVDLPVRLAEAFVITVGGMDTRTALERDEVLQKILTVCRDGGMTLASSVVDPQMLYLQAMMGGKSFTSERTPGGVSWWSSKSGDIEKSAYAAATVDAAARGKAQAELLDVKLTGVLAFETLNEGRFTFMDLPEGTHEVQVKVTYRIE